jgi:hypothetical protein
MDRVWKSGASGTPPVHTENASSGYPTAGNPGTGTPATKPGPWWYHMITEEIRAVIADAGLTPDKAQTNQLLAAITGKIGAAIIGVNVLNRDVTQAEVTNTTTETTVYTFSVPGGTLGTNKALRLKLLGDHFNDDGASRDLTIRVKFGGTTILSGTLTVTATSGRLPFIGEVQLVAANSALAQIASGDFIMGNQGSASGTMAATGFTFLNGMHNAVAEDSGVNRTLSVTIQHAAASGNISFRLHTATLELLP